ncbi:MAG TPA: type I DNA topoisomerase [Oscillatoriales cyanobacterium M4454_W2019_049]|nr:type I DNA topoisomerase [Oscillatoriales cyanobacterium M4454_W2019_049]
MTKLLLIESPGKLKKLSQILGSGWIVKASMGHVRELANDGESSLGFDLEGDRVWCRYQPRGSRGKQTLADLKRAVEGASQVYLGTDPDREGETIAWHLQQALRIHRPLRVTYSEITPAAVRQAIDRPRPLDANLVAAGRARDCLDKLVGYKGSPLLWKLNNGAKSMGRVQSATLHLICLREGEIVAFVPEDYWSVWVEYQEGFKAFYRSSLNLKKTVAEKEADDAAEKLPERPESDRVSTQAEADRLVEIARSHSHCVVKIERQNTRRNPPPPFTTSTLQQAAGSRYKWGSDKTMKVAQTLYEGGHITYMRTDSVTLSPDFCAAARRWLEQHDADNIPSQTRKFRAKAGAQEAHEAIRPTHVENTPERLPDLSVDSAKLYDLIWNRAIASQCRPAELQKTRVVTQSGDIFWEARGQVVTFAGYTRYWNNLSADTHLPPLQEGQDLTLKKADSEKKQTQPSPRYTEPKLVQLMERKGIGRPSTYAPTIRTLKDRNYVDLGKDKKLHPTQLGLEVDLFLRQVLPDLLQPEFTAKMEATLDEIAAGKQDWECYLNHWYRDYLSPALTQAKQQVSNYRSPSTLTHSAASSPEKSTQKASKQTRSRKTKSESKTAASPSSIACPKCDRPMSKVPSKSPKLATDHFLKCDEKLGGCGAVMFWSDRQKQYELPYSERKHTEKTATTNSQTSQNWWEQPIETESALPPWLKGRKKKKGRSKRHIKTPEMSDIRCPKCDRFMSKILSKSPKLAADHFLKCDRSLGGCDTVMFWSDKYQQYELPYGSQPKTTPQLTDYKCPVCQSHLEEYHYTKEGIEKSMLRCSDVKNRREQCKDVAYFRSRSERWWSPKFGEM